MSDFDGEEDQIVRDFRHYDPKVSSKLFKLSDELVSQHKTVCDKQTWKLKGSMYGVGFHLDQCKKTKITCQPKLLAIAAILVKTTIPIWLSTEM